MTIYFTQPFENRVCSSDRNDKVTNECISVCLLVILFEAAGHEHQHS